MLSAAHVLAMDAKNLLDVVDSVRIRYPDLFTIEHVLNTTEFKLPETPEEFNFTTDQACCDVQNLTTEPSANNIDGFNNFPDETMEQQTYQNLCSISKNPVVLGNDETYVNKYQIEPLNKVENIYDNECIVSAQVNNFSVDTKNEIIPTTADNPLSIAVPISSMKPPVAAKPGKYYSFRLKLLLCLVKNNA